MKFRFIALVLLLAPIPIAAQVVITEVMYNTEGADSGREWVEIQNKSNAAIDLTTWRLFEGDSNHYIKRDAGGTIPSGAYAIIADDPNAFTADYPDNSTLVFDSSFSLRNTGETVILRNGQLEDKDSVSYDPSIGADGDGNSLQKVDGQWIAAAPSPGSGNNGSTSGATDDSKEEEDDSYQTRESTSVFAPKVPEKSISLDVIHAPETTVVGAGARFEAQAFGFKGEPLTRRSARYIWSFGDGGRAEGEEVQHAYAYPDEYAVSVTAVSGKYTASGRFTVSAIPSDIRITDVGGAHDFYIEIANKTDVEIDLSRWILSAGDTQFRIPDDTYVHAKHAIRFPPMITGLARPDNICNDTIALLYPNGTRASGYRCMPVQYPLAARTKAAPADNNASPMRAELPEQREEEAGTPMELPHEPVQQAASAIGATRGGMPEKPSGSGTRDNPPIWLWVLATGGLVGIAIAGLVASRKQSHAGNLADEFEVIEETEISWKNQ